VNEQLMEHLTVPGGTARPSLHALAWEGPRISEGILAADDGRWWWIAGGVPRMLPPSMYRSRELEERYRSELRRLGLAVDAGHTGGGRLGRVQTKTIDRFGAEWLMFRDWGHLVQAPAGQEQEYQGGLWANTLSAFRSKTFLQGRIGGKLCLDAGCGNGRFTAAALAEGAREVIAVDIGWGVEATYERFRADPRVHVVQASLFDLPVRRVEAAFSIGVLMHTGDAGRAFASIAQRVEPGGLLAVRMYHRGNWAYEAVDAGIRAVTTRLNKPAQVRLSRGLARFGAWLGARDRKRPGSRMRWYQVLRNWPTVHHNLDWWSAPVASHHTSGEVSGWGEAAGLRVVRAEPSPESSRYGFWEWPEALTILFERAAAGEQCVAGVIGRAVSEERGAVG
jgi:SAM-dependent methyltransferase/uncharacterized protein YbaR (Trm112 family)